MSRAASSPVNPECKPQPVKWTPNGLLDRPKHVSSRSSMNESRKMPQASGSGLRLAGNGAAGNWVMSY